MVLGLAVAVLVALGCMTLIPPRRPPIDFSSARQGAGSVPSGAQVRFRETRWWELGPKDWDPYKEVRELRRNIGYLSDSDPRAVELLKKTRAIWDDAPINPAMDGAAIRIPGYVVPLDRSDRGTSEFLLVPYFGACIHTPPPPSNQIIHVRLPRFERGLHTMDQIWANGTLRATRTDSTMGMSSYSMAAQSIEPYVAPAR
jgi:hypothetical protein